VDAQQRTALVAGHEIPRVGLELVLDGIDQPGRPIEADDLVAAEQAPEQLIEPLEMIHVAMADENVADAEHLPRRQWR
jgi:hypothetical protein